MHNLQLFLEQTTKLLNENEAFNQEQIKFAAECIQKELGTTTRKQTTYSLPLTVKAPKNKQERKVHDPIIYKSQKQLPQPCSLRTKCTISCCSCLLNNHPQLLVKPQDDPLYGDSSSYILLSNVIISKANTQWIRAGNLAVFSIPSISLYTEDNTFLYLCFTNVNSPTYYY